MTTTLDSPQPIVEAKGGTRSERVTIRPFEGIRDTESVLESVRLLIGGDYHEAGSIVVEAEALGKAALQLDLPAQAELRQALKETSVPPKNCALVVIGTSRTHRASTVLLKERLTKDASYQPELTVSREASLIFGDLAGFTITVAVVLLDSIPPAPLKPNAAGTWLGRADFAVSPERQETSFSPEELTAAVREAYELPEGAMRFITFDDDLLAAEDLSDAVRVYVESDVLQWLRNDAEDPVSMQQQVDLAIMAYDATAQELVRQIRVEHQDLEKFLTESDVEPYPAVHRFFEHLAAKCRLSLTDVLRMASDSKMIRPYLEANFDASKYTLRALKEIR